MHKLNIGTTPKFKEPQIFWCSKCDFNQVKSDDEATGQFIKMNGHIYNHKTQDIEADWPAIVFAICADCIGSDEENMDMLALFIRNETKLR